MTQQNPPEDRPPRRSRRHRADETAPPAPPAPGTSVSRPVESPAPAPRYGMLLPPGESIDQYIVAPRPGREHDQRNQPAGSGADQHRGGGPARAAWEAPSGQDRQPVFPAHHPSSAGYTPSNPAAHSAYSAYAGPRAGAPVDREEAERRKRRGRATVMAVVGGLLLVFAPLVGLAITTAQSLDSAMAGILTAEPVVNGGSLDLPADTGLAITSATAQELTQCTVAGPGGSEVPVSVADSSPTREGSAALSGARFRTQGAGEYTIACGDVADDARLTVGPPVVVRPDGTGWATAVALGAVGGALLVAGLVLRSRLKG